MGDFKNVYKQFARTDPKTIMAFKEAEVARGNRASMGDYAELSMFDLRNEVCFRLMVNDRTVGFATARFVGDSRQLARIYVMPEFRRHGVASWVLDQMPVTHLNVPVRYIHLLSLCRKKGYQYRERQASPYLAELVRPPRTTKKEYNSRGTTRRIPAGQLG